MQPQMAVTLSLANGTSMVTRVFLKTVLNMWMSWPVWRLHQGRGNVAVIDGVKGFTGAQVNARHLRAGAALVIAGLAATDIR